MLNSVHFWSGGRSADAQYVAVSSQDGYCSLLAFGKDELGTRLSTSGNLFYLLNSCFSIPLLPEAPCAL